MSDAIASEMRDIVRRAAEPVRAGESIKALINRSARRLGINHRRVRTFWYGQSCAVKAWEADALRQADLAMLSERRRLLAAELHATKMRLNALKGSGDATNTTMGGSQTGEHVGVGR